MIRFTFLKGKSIVHESQSDPTRVNAERTAVSIPIAVARNSGGFGLWWWERKEREQSEIPNRRKNLSGCDVVG